MTEPGYIAPASPGWWVRTNRVGINASGYNWEVSATGSRVSKGTAAGAYGWAGAAVGVKPVLLTFIGANVSTSGSVTIPAHAVGDLILIFDYSDGSNVTPVPPAAGGTVPTWIDVPNCANTGANSNASRTTYCIATATNHTSGTWSGGSTYLIAAVVRGCTATPIGGSLETGSTAAGSASAPAVTLARADDSSMLLHFMGHRFGAAFTAWDAAPAGYTQRIASVSSTGVCLLTKDVVTSSAGVTQTMNGTVNNGYRGSTVEVRYH